MALKATCPVGLSILLQLCHFLPRWLTEWRPACKTDKVRGSLLESFAIVLIAWHQGHQSPLDVLKSGQSYSYVLWWIVRQPQEFVTWPVTVLPVIRSEYNEAMIYRNMLYAKAFWQKAFRIQDRELVTQGKIVSVVSTDLTTVLQAWS